MATKNADAAGADEAAPKKGKKKLILIVLLVLLLGGGGGGAWWFLNKKNHKPDAEAEADAEAEEPKGAHGAKKTEFLSIEPWFTVNLQGEDAERYLQTGLVFEFTAPKTGERMKELMPIIRSRLLLLLSGKTAEDLNTPDGKTLLADEILDNVRDALADKAAAKGLVAVHFSVFVIQ